jgi:hypothetical protein
MVVNEYLISLLVQRALIRQVGAILADPYQKPEETTAKLLRLAIKENLCTRSPSLSYGTREQKETHCAPCLIAWAQRHADLDDLLKPENRSMEPCQLHKSQL